MGEVSLFICHLILVIAGGYPASTPDEHWATSEGNDQYQMTNGHRD